MMKQNKEQDQRWTESNPCLDITQHDALNSVIWAGTFIWAGLVILLSSQQGYSEEQGWSLFFIGAGLLVLAEVLIRLQSKAYRRGVVGSLIWAGILLGLGTNGWGYILPVVLILVGASILRSITVR